MDKSRYHRLIEGSTDVSQCDDDLVRHVYEQVFRTDFTAPGVALLTFNESITSRTLRFFMWSLKNSLSILHHTTSGKHLAYLSSGRFDSRATTKFHLDGAPDQAFLMLGYESSSVHSEISIADYSQAAHDWKMTPQELLADFNPMFADNEQRLLPYASRLSAFNSAQSHILLLNNSSQPYHPNGENLLGVMHQAAIVPNPQAQRIINSTMMTTMTSLNDEPMGQDVQKQFLETNHISGAL